MKNVLIAGGSGLIGTRLTELLLERGYAVSHLSRNKKSRNNVTVYQWNPATGHLEDGAVRQADYIVNLAGAGIADKAWTKERRNEIIHSRVNSAKTILETLEKNNHHVKCIVCASAIGYYKKNSEEVMREISEAGNDFLAYTTQRWEEASLQFEITGIRTVIIRTGIVLSLKGGALPEMYKPLRFGIAGYFGKADQYYSWIHIDDVCGIYIKAIEEENMQGIYNAVAPHPETNKNFMKTLTEVKEGFSVLIPIPSFALRILLGERASIVLDGQKVSCEKIMEAGYVFQFIDLSQAFEDILKKK